jgi:hypothetical protein
VTLSNGLTGLLTITRGLVRLASRMKGIQLTHGSGASVEYATYVQEDRTKVFIKL